MVLYKKPVCLAQVLWNTLCAKDIEPDSSSLEKPWYKISLFWFCIKYIVDCGEGAVVETLKTSIGGEV